MNTAKMTNEEFGLMMEKRLKPVLEEALEDTLTKTSDRYDTKDFVGEKWVVELKCRRAVDSLGRPVSSRTFSNWFMSATKIEMAKQQKKDVVFFYYFERDETLFYIVYSDEEFSTFKVEYTRLQEPQGKVVRHQKNFSIPFSSWDLLRDFAAERKAAAEETNSILEAKASLCIC